MPSLQQVQPMPDPIRPAPPVSVRRARLDCAIDRLQIGLDPNPDAPPIVLGPRAGLVLKQFPILHGGIPAETREAVAVAMDKLVEEHGVAAVLRCAALIAEVNGIQS